MELLELYLLLEPTSTAVERDGAAVKQFQEVTRNKAGADTMDNRMRAKQEAPSWKKILDHGLVRPAAQDSWDFKNRRISSGTRSLGTMSDEHKDALSRSAKKLKIGSVQDRVLELSVEKQETDALDDSEVPVPSHSMSASSSKPPEVTEALFDDLGWFREHSCGRLRK